MQQVGIAVVGAGFITDYHLAGLAAVPRASVRLIASRTADKAAALAQRFHVPETTTDLAAALSRPDIDAVVITTPDDTHEEVAARAARAGKAMLLQKPMATSSASCRRILDAARSAGVDLQVSFMHRYFEEVEAARKLIGSGAIGTVTSARMRNATPGPDWADWFFKRQRVVGGAVLQLGSHGIDLVEYLLGAIEGVSAHTATLRPTRTLRDGRTVPVENADSAWATYRLANGAHVNHEISMIECKGTDRFRMEIYGTHGTIWLRTELGPLAVYAPGTHGHEAWVTPELPQPPFGQRQHQRWIDGLTGTEPPEATAQAGLRGLIIAEAIEQSSADDGRWSIIPGNGK